MQRQAETSMIEKKAVTPRALKPLAIAFCQYYVTGETAGNGLRSAQKAGYGGTDPTLGTTACRLLNDNRVKRLIEELTEEQWEKNGGEINLLRKKLWREYQNATAVGDRTNSLRALELWGKTFAAFSDRVITRDDDEVVALRESMRVEAELLVSIRMKAIESGQLKQVESKEVKS